MLSFPLEKQLSVAATDMLSQIAAVYSQNNSTCSIMKRFQEYSGCHYLYHNIFICLTTNHREIATITNIVNSTLIIIILSQTGN